jgi:DNA polymerase I-like protein with 3'-5' exonuclease and polymerase domains
MDLHDPYTEAAAEMFRIPRDEVTDEQRAYAKRRTYFLAYNGIDCPQDWMEGVLHFQVT